jgi:hypothetical protein
MSSATQNLRASRSARGFDIREIAQIVVTARPIAEPNWTHFAKFDPSQRIFGHLSPAGSDLARHFVATVRQKERS